ncbi:HtaA domain-containing protein [Kineococcus sp. LSe6-4]|uniref:HtaA domain-containing protein n=1 Tax=Kineococcus halophytocola TaxID=3234027 RepID=A0ABV4GZL1_9ACTN
MTAGVTAGPGLVWALKRSFTDYVESMDDGVVEVAGGATRLPDGSFHFPPLPSPDPAVLRFGGTVTCSGHQGMLVVRWADPEVLDHGGRRWLTVADEDEPGGRRTFLDLGGGTTDGATVRHPRPVLTALGAEVFFDTYRPGTVFDPVLLVLGTGAPAPAG